MKVYGMGLGTGGRVVIATTSKAAAARAMGVSLHTFNQYASVTANPAEIEAANAEPGVVLVEVKRWSGKFRRKREGERLR